MGLGPMATPGKDSARESNGSAIADLFTPPGVIWVLRERIQTNSGREELLLRKERVSWSRHGMTASTGW